MKHLNVEVTISKNGFQVTKSINGKMDFKLLSLKLSYINSVLEIGYTTDRNSGSIPNFSGNGASIGSGPHLNHYFSIQYLEWAVDTEQLEAAYFGWKRKR